MSLAVSTFSDADKALYYDITVSMDSYQYSCLKKVIGIKAKEFSRGDVARDLAAWIDQHVLSNLEDYCSLLQVELKKKRKT
jgi:hypothetical protein